MSRRLLRTAFAFFAIVVPAFAYAAPASASGPTIEHDRFVVSFADDFILDLCGIETTTTWTQVQTVMTFSDGRVQVHVERTFVSDDPRLPVERGSGTTFIAPDGTRTVIGKPIQLIGPDGGVRILDAGPVQFGDELLVRGPHPSLVVGSLAPYYCPPGS